MPKEEPGNMAASSLCTAKMSKYSGYVKDFFVLAI
jgi:hypothetical protein